MPACYATHIEERVKTARYLKYGGYIGIGFGATASALKVQEVCRTGVTEACERVRFTETGSFVGSMAGGSLGAWAGSGAASSLCIGIGLASGGTGGMVCSLMLVGVGSYLGSKGGEKAGLLVGEKVYERAKN